MLPTVHSCNVQISKRKKSNVQISKRKKSKSEPKYDRAYHLGCAGEGESPDVSGDEVDETIRHSDVTGVGVDNTLVIELGSVKEVTEC